MTSSYLLYLLYSLRAPSTIFIWSFLDAQVFNRNFFSVSLHCKLTCKMRHRELETRISISKNFAEYLKNWTFFQFTDFIFKNIAVLILHSTTVNYFRIINKIKLYNQYQWEKTMALLFARLLDSIVFSCVVYGKEMVKEGREVSIRSVVCN